MYEFVDKLRELRRAYIKINFFNHALDSISVFLFFSILALLTGISVYYALLPTLILIGWSFRKRRDVFSGLKDKYGYFDERLKAAYDNKHEDNIIVRDLSREISEKLDNVRYSAFLGVKKSWVRVLVPVFFSFIIITLAFADIEPLQLPSLNFNIEETTAQIEKAEVEGLQSAPSEGVSEDIFGEASIAKIEGEEVELELLPGGGEIRIREESRVRESTLSFEGAPEFLPSEALTEEIPVKYEEVIKRYFEKLVTGE